MWNIVDGVRREGSMTEEQYEEVDLAALPDDELVEQMHNDLYDGMADEIAEGTNLLLGRNWEPDRVLNDALVEGMRIVGIDFRDGILFVPEVLLAANAMKAGMGLLRPLLAETGTQRIGKVVIGTVKGDIHDIGKNLVAMMLEGAGFEVVDLGINNPVESYLSALEEHQPDILGMSALLTTTMPYMKVVIEELEKQGIRDDYIVLVGGAPLNEDFGRAIGADAYCRDAAVAAETASALVLARRAAGGRTAPRRPLLRVPGRRRRVAGDARGGARDVLPHGLPGPALRPVGGAGVPAGRASRVGAGDVRELPPGRVSRPDGRRGAARAGRVGGGVPVAAARGPPDRVRRPGPRAGGVRRGSRRGGRSRGRGRWL